MIEKDHYVPTSRIEAFSDGVFAIVITLLSFQFKVPNLTPGATLKQNLQELSAISSNFTAFVFSFIFVAIFWINHHQLYHSIKVTDSRLLWLNVHLLFWITLIPFPISMVGDHTKEVISAMSLGVVLLMCCVAAFMIRSYTFHGGKLFDKTISEKSVKMSMTINLIAIVLNVIAIFSSFFSVYIAYVIFVVVLGLFIIPQRLRKRN